MWEWLTEGWSWWSFLAGIFPGAWLGLVLAALLAMAGRGEEREHG